MILFFSKFLYFLKYFFFKISLNPVECSYSIGPPVDAVGPALGRQSVLQVYPPCPDYKTPISGVSFNLTVQDVGICGVKCCILLTCLVYMAIYDLEI